MIFVSPGEDAKDQLLFKDPTTTINSVRRAEDSFILGAVFNLPPPRQDELRYSFQPRVKLKPAHN